MKPLAIDLFCGLGGWTEGLLAEGYDVIGFDIERHRYAERMMPDGGPGKNDRLGGGSWFVPPPGRKCGAKNNPDGRNDRDAPLTGRWIEYPAQLVVQDVLTLHGSQFKDAALIVASPPCQEYSYMAMPWSRAKAMAAAIRADETGQKLADLNRLFDACFRIQAEASMAAGRHVPMVVENVRGAQRWVGRARWNFGSFYLWGDVPALMPVARLARKSRDGGSWFGDYCALREGIKQQGSGREWFAGCGRISRLTSSNSPLRKQASAMIAKIPLPLSRHIAAVYRP